MGHQMGFTAFFQFSIGDNSQSSSDPLSTPLLHVFPLSFFFFIFLHYCIPALKIMPVSLHFSRLSQELRFSNQSCWLFEYSMTGNDYQS